MLDSHHLTIELGKRNAATGALFVAIINLVGWLGDSWYAEKMRDVPTLAIVLNIYFGIFLLGALAWTSNRIYPRASIGFTSYFNFINLYNLFILPITLVELLIISSLYESLILGFGWTMYLLIAIHLIGVFSICAVIFRSEMLLYDLGIRKTLLAQLPKLFVSFVFSLIGLALMFTSWFLWMQLPDATRGVIERHIQGFWKVISSI